MFASRTLLEHLARGIGGIGSLVTAVIIAPTHPWLSLASVAVALILLRGCPMCWAVGLFETITAKLRGRRAPEACIDGRCARPHER